MYLVSCGQRVGLKDITREKELQKDGRKEKKGEKNERQEKEAYE